jgi:nucleoside-diphosphate-sugar epimerase
VINWLTDWLGTASFYEVQKPPASTDMVLLDVRELTDREGNTTSALRRHIQAGLDSRRAGKRIVVCCDRGVSRSNAIAFGILLASGVSDNNATALLREKFGVIEINLGLLRDVRSLFLISRAESSSRKRILVTGASGFVGRALAEALEPAHELVCLSRAAVDLAGDLHSLDAFVAQHEIGFILHLAHPRMRSNPSALPEALAMMRNLLEVCRLNKVGILYLSGLTVFSGHISAQALTADSSLAPRHRGLYGETKFLCEQLIQSFREIYALDAIVLRPAALYGPGMDQAAFISKYFSAAARSDVIRTHLYRNGPPLFDFLHLDDLIAAIGRALDVKPSAPLNLGTGVGTTTFDLARLITRITSSPSKVETIEIDDETSKVIVSPAEAEASIGWRATTSLENGLKEIWRATNAQRSLAVS